MFSQATPIITALLHSPLKLDFIYTIAINVRNNITLSQHGFSRLVMCTKRKLIGKKIEVAIPSNKSSNVQLLDDCRVRRRYFSEGEKGRPEIRLLFAG